MSINPPGMALALREWVWHGERRTQLHVAVTGPVARAVVIGLITATPWLFGGVQARVQVWLFAGVLAASACWLVEQVARRGTAMALPVAIIPLVGAIGLGVIQFLPLGREANAVLSPRGQELREALLAGAGSWEGSLLGDQEISAEARRSTVSLYPASTRRDLSLLVLGTAVFLLGTAYFRSPRAQAWLCGFVAVNGAAIACFGLVQQLTWNGLLYWTVPLTRGGRPFGPFVNRNNAGGFLGLCLACAVGLMFLAVGRDGAGDPGRGRTRSPEDAQLLARCRQRLTALFADLDGPVIVALCLAACLVGGILCCLSRGAWAAVTGAFCLVLIAVLCARRRRFRLWPIAAAAAAGLGLMGWVGMSDFVQTRFATLLDEQTISQTRIPHWRDGLSAAADFWPLGSGLGTYRYVYRPYQQRLSEAWYYHAENQYLEALVEGGIVGLGLMLAAIGLVGAGAWRLVRDDPDPRASAFGIVGLFALAGQAIHGFFDYALYIPANMLLFAVLCGGVSGRAAQLAAEGFSRPRFALPRIRRASPLLAASMFAGVAWGCLETRGVAAVESALEQARFSQPPNEVSPGVLLDAMQCLELALGRREDDAEAQHRMATLWLHLYRVRAQQQLREETGWDADDPRLWQATSQIILHGRAHHFLRNHLPAELEQLRSRPVIRAHLLPALKHLILARRACPLVAEVHVTIAELCVLAADPAHDRVSIERALRLGPSDVDLLFRCGLLELQAGRRESACDRWRRCLTLSPRYLADVLKLGAAQLGMRETIEKVLPESPKLLVELAQERYGGEAHGEIRRLLAERAARLLKRADLQEEEEHYLRGSALALQGRYPQAIADLSRAVALCPQKADWRYQLALLHKHEGRISEAHEQAKLCARMDPYNLQYRELLQQINHIRVTTGIGLE